MGKYVLLPYQDSAAPQLFGPSGGLPRGLVHFLSGFIGRAATESWFGSLIIGAGFLAAGYFSTFSWAMNAHHLGRASETWSTVPGDVMPSKGVSSRDCRGKHIIPPMFNAPAGHCKNTYRIFAIGVCSMLIGAWIVLSGIGRMIDS